MNRDVFINGLAFQITNNAPLNVKLQNFTTLPFTHQSGGYQDDGTYKDGFISVHSQFVISIREARDFQTDGPYKRAADYRNANPCRFNQRQGPIEIYLWDGQTFAAPPDDAPATFKNPDWLMYKGRWGNWEMGYVGYDDIDFPGLGTLEGSSVAQLESGPEGLFRPTEYPKPK